VGVSHGWCKRDAAVLFLSCWLTPPRPFHVRPAQWKCVKGPSCCSSSTPPRQLPEAGIRGLLSKSQLMRRRQRRTLPSCYEVLLVRRDVCCLARVLPWLVLFVPWLVILDRIARYCEALSWAPKTSRPGRERSSRQVWS